MKTKNYVYLICFLAVLFSFSSIADVFSTLGLNEKTARTTFLSNIVGQINAEPLSVSSSEDFGGSQEAYVKIRQELKEFKIPFTKNLTSLSAEAKRQAATELCAYVKNYVNSPEFQEDYAARRAAAKPVEEPYRPDEAQIREMKKSLNEGEKQLAAAKKSNMLTAEQLSSASKGLEDMKRQLRQYDDPTPNKTLWEKKFPEDPAVAVKNRLQEYLDLAATVDFDAKTNGTGKKQKFVNPEYENKSLKWKAIYRAGREVNTATTDFVKKWLQGPVIDKANLRPLTISENSLQVSGSTVSKNQETSPAKNAEKKSFLDKVKEKAAKAAKDL